MQFIVRYWVLHPPLGDGQGEWTDHSSHPPSRLGLHNAILSAEDRLSILRGRLGSLPHGCDIFIESEGRSVLLSVGEAGELLELLEHGNLTWEAFERLVEGRSPGRLSASGVSPSPHPDRGVAEYQEADELHRIDLDA